MVPDTDMSCHVMSWFVMTCHLQLMRVRNSFVVPDTVFSCYVMSLTIDVGAELLHRGSGHSHVFEHSLQLGGELASTFVLQLRNHVLLAVVGDTFVEQQSFGFGKEMVGKMLLFETLWEAGYATQNRLNLSVCLSVSQFSLIWLWQACFGYRLCHMRAMIPNYRTRFLPKCCL